MSESKRSRLKRRAVTIPAMLGATALAIVLFPLLFVGALIYDSIRLRPRTPTVRVYLFALQYAINDSNDSCACV
jgi:hypothetical protein